MRLSSITQCNAAGPQVWCISACCHHWLHALVGGAVYSRESSCWWEELQLRRWQDDPLSGGEGRAGSGRRYRRWDWAVRRCQTEPCQRGGQRASTAADGLVTAAIAAGACGVPPCHCCCKLCCWAASGRRLLRGCCCGGVGQGGGWGRWVGEGGRRCRQGRWCRGRCYWAHNSVDLSQ